MWAYRSRNALCSLWPLWPLWPCGSGSSCGTGHCYQVIIRRGSGNAHRVVPVRTVNKTIIGYQVPLIICLIWIKSRHLFQSRPHRPWYTLRPHRTRRASRPLRTTAAAAGIWRTRTAWLAAAISCLAILVILTARIYGIPIHIITPIDILCHLAFCRGMLPAMRPVSADSMFSAFIHTSSSRFFPFPHPLPSRPAISICPIFRLVRPRTHWNHA